MLVGHNYAQDYFVLIRTDNHQPFYVRLGGQYYSSAADGHLILSQLKDSTYTIIVGIPPHGAAGEQTYTFAVNHTDRELEIRPHGEAGWGLYNPMGNDWLAAQNTAREEIHAVGIRREDDFSRMMAGIVQDTAVLYNNYVATAPVDTPATANTPAIATRLDSDRTDTSSTVATKPANTTRLDSPTITKPDSAIATLKPVDTPTTASTPIHTDTAATTTAPQYRPVAGTALHRSAPVVDSSSQQQLFRPLPAIVKLSERKGARYMRLVYADRGMGTKADTIVLYILYDTVATAAAQKHHSADSSRLPAMRSHGPNPDSPTQAQGAPNKAVMPVPINSAADKSRIADSGQKGATRAPLPYVNSDCHNFASDYDVDKLRVKMLAAEKDEERIAAALKVFKAKCFYTRQVRALSEVFATDAGKYRFFEAAWPYAADEHFRELSALLTDPVYVAKFKTLMGGR
ncbi:hypothetical protein GCM10011511_26130 [Puia dinghuensis]|uniref:DUF4476 domain-containing protein n=1 Tax=Puia dinghuensis TaxID=1792502 RepID=A0A8J2XT96_9BACT|nr:hypothetical protein GCM10011511_26130 [Puia dinghuensis]